MRRTLLLGFGVMAALGAGLGAYLLWSFLFVQPCAITHDTSSVLIDLRNMGGYPANLIRFRITEVSSRRVVWEFEAVENFAFFWSVRLRLGPNTASPEAILQARVTVPSEGGVFCLHANQLYELDAWTFNSGRRYHTHARFAMPSGLDGPCPPKVNGRAPG
jgi:hypothetical protein